MMERKTYTREDLDIVCVVFVKGQQPFNPAAIKSQFLHVFIVVHEDTWQGQIGWR